jgi:hypothetical protein
MEHYCDTCINKRTPKDVEPCIHCICAHEHAPRNNWAPRSIDDATPEEWDAASRAVMTKASTVTISTATANDRQIGGTHYKMNGIQTWDYIASNGIGYFEGNIIKYVSRWRHKGGMQDLEKARHYLDKLIEMEGRK